MEVKSPCLQAGAGHFRIKCALLARNSLPWMLAEEACKEGGIEAVSKEEKHRGRAWVGSEGMLPKLIILTSTRDSGLKESDETQLFTNFEQLSTIIFPLINTILRNILLKVLISKTFSFREMNIRKMLSLVCCFLFSPSLTPSLFSSFLCSTMF